MPCTRGRTRRCYIASKHGPGDPVPPPTDGCQESPSLPMMYVEVRVRAGRPVQQISSLCDVNRCDGRNADAPHLEWHAPAPPRQCRCWCSILPPLRRVSPGVAPGGRPLLLLYTAAVTSTVLKYCRCACADWNGGVPAKHHLSSAFCIGGCKEHAVCVTQSSCSAPEPDRGQTASRPPADPLSTGPWMQRMHQLCILHVFLFLSTPGNHE